MVYAISDIHGCYKTLRSLIQMLEQASVDNTYYFLGDYIDRGPDSKKVLYYLIDIKKNNNKIQIIRGNHEQMMLNVYKHSRKDDYLLWHQNGCEPTLTNFNIPLGILEIKSYLPSSYIDFIELLPYYIETENYLLVHGGFNFQSSDPFSDFESMLWIRNLDYNRTLSKGKTIIHGHTSEPAEMITSNIINKSRVIGIDSGCVYKKHTGLGKLSALNLETMELTSIENIDF